MTLCMHLSEIFANDWHIYLQPMETVLIPNVNVTLKTGNTRQNTANDINIIVWGGTKSPSDRRFPVTTIRRAAL